MSGKERAFRLSEIVSALGGERTGTDDPLIVRIATLENAGKGEITFFSNPRYRSRLGACSASALILSPDAAGLWSRPAILAVDPYLYFAEVANLFSPARAVCPGIHHSAVVESSLGDEVEVAAGA